MSGRPLQRNQQHTPGSGHVGTMELMPQRIAAVYCFLVGLAISGCATRLGSDPDWGRQLLDAAAKKSTVQEISAFLDAEPVKCESLPSYPIVGLLIEDHGGPTVASIDPTGPAARSGIRKGDKILSINSKPVKGVKEGSEIIRSEAGPDHPIVIETQRGPYQVTPKYPKRVSQCYWEVADARIRQSTVDSDAGPGIGQAPSKGIAYRRLFRGVCRFFDGHASQCEYIWQNLRAQQP